MPSWSIPGKTCGTAAALIASTAVAMLPSGRFFMPIGIDRPDDSCRCTCDSTVRAPIAPQADGVGDVLRGDRVEELAPDRQAELGSPRSSSWRAIRRPRFTSPEPSRPGSLIRPFQPTVERGFSKYTRITTSRSSDEPLGDRTQALGVLERRRRRRAPSTGRPRPAAGRRRRSARRSTGLPAGDARSVRGRRSAAARRAARAGRDQRDGLLDPPVDDTATAADRGRVFMVMGPFRRRTAEGRSQPAGEQEKARTVVLAFGPAAVRWVGVSDRLSRPAPKPATQKIANSNASRNRR